MSYCHPRGDNIRHILGPEHSWTQIEGTTVTILVVAATVGKFIRSFEFNEPRGWKLGEGNL
jgi:hypothetical protein